MDVIYDQIVIFSKRASYFVVDSNLSGKEEERRVITIKYKNNLPLVYVGLIDAGSNKKIVVDAHLDFASSKTIIPTYIANEMNLSFAGSDETATGAGIIHIPYYEVSIEIFDKIYDNIHVGCLDLPEQTPAKALVGRDILDNYRICLDGIKKEITVW
jgi:hypothetical protein